MRAMNMKMMAMVMVMMSICGVQLVVVALWGRRRCLCVWLHQGTRRGSSCSPQAGGDGGFVAGPVATSCLGGDGRSVVFAGSTLQASS
jgi:hypothetical protein